MLRTRLRAVAAASALALALATGVTGATFASATEAEPDYLVGLHNTKAGAGECPKGWDGKTSYWHFVAPPKSKTDFQSITLYFGDEKMVIDDWIEHPLPGDAYVAVPEGKTLESLTGGLFGYDGGDGRLVRLSHTCQADVVLVEKLEVAKTATTSYNRAHAWSLDKSVDVNEVKLYTDGSGDTTVNYTVDVGYEGATDSGWNVSGSITITNTGDLDAVVTSIEDVMTLGEVPVTVATTCAVPFGLAKGESKVCAYSEDVDGAIDGVNDVTVGTEAGNEYYADATVAWGAPASESDKTVTVTDVGDLTGTKSKSFTAPTGGSVTYSVDLAYDDYGQDQCGDHVYGNVATLTGDDDEVLADDDESVTAKVQCMVFKGDTAWAAGDRYNKRGNWATYVTGEDKVVDLLAGQTMKAGTVTLSDVDAEGMVTITVTLAGDWRFADKAENLKVQGYDDKPSGNPNPGGFDDKADCDASSTTCSITVKDADYYGIHADVGRWIPDPKF